MLYKCFACTRNEEKLCHCGQPLNYPSDEVKALVEATTELNLADEIGISELRDVEIRFRVTCH